MIHAIFSVAYAQDASAAAPLSTTAANPEIPLDQLTLLLGPKTKEQLIGEADAWRDILQAKSQEVASLASASKNAELSPEEKTKFIEQATALADERQRIVDRLDAVLSALVALGTDEDVVGYRAYIAQNSGPPIPVSQVDVKDQSVILTTAKAWVMSDEGGIRWGLNILKFLAVLIVFRLVAGIVGRISAKALGV